MRPRLRTFASLLGPPVMGAAYALALVLYEHRGVDPSHQAFSLALAWALPLGLTLGAAAGAMSQLRGRWRGDSNAHWRGRTLFLLGYWHVTASLWAMAARPSLASETWYARGGLRRLTQVLAADALGPRALAALALGAALVYALGGPSRLRLTLSALSRPSRLRLTLAALGRPSRLRLALARWLEGASPQATVARRPGRRQLELHLERRKAPGARAARPRRSSIAALLGLTALALTIVSPGRQRSSSGPNLVLIGFGSLDATSLDTETTPALEAFAREGVFFDQALVSTTDPSMGRAVWLSGLEPHQLRASGGPEGGSEGEPEESRPERLTKAGYRSAIMGDERLAKRFAGLTLDAPALERWPLALEPLRLLAASLAPHLGLDSPARRDGDTASESVERALRFVDEGTKPFALTLFLPEARPPFAGACPRALAFTDASYRGRCKYRTCDATPGAPPRDDDDRRQELALRRGALACDDAALERLLEGLRARGLEDTTLVAAFGEGGATAPKAGESGATALDDRTLRAPLIVRQGRTFAPARRRENVRDVDLAPTIDDVFRLAKADDSTGRSLAAALRGELAIEANAFAEADVHGAAAPNGSLGRRWALTAGQHRLVAQAARRGLAVELFDRVADPNQARDRSTEAPALRDAMRDEVLRLVLREHALMLRSGHVMPRPTPSLSSEGHVMPRPTPSLSGEGHEMARPTPALPAKRSQVPEGELHERQRSLLDALQDAEREHCPLDSPPQATLSTLAPDVWAPPHPSRRRVTLGAARERAETRDALVVPTPSTLRLPLRPGPHARLRVAPAPLSPPESPLRVEVRARRRGAPAELLEAFELGAAEASRWIEHEIDLGRFAGGSIELELRALSDATEGPALAWGSPALIEAATPELPYNVVLVALQTDNAPSDLGHVAARGVVFPPELGRVAARGVVFPDFVPAATWREPELLALLSGMRSGELGLDVGGGPPSKAALDAFYARRPPLLTRRFEQAGATTLALHEASSRVGGPLALDLGFDSLVELGSSTPTVTASAAEFGPWLEQHRRERFFALALLDIGEHGSGHGGPRATIDALLAPLQRLDLERETIVAIVTTGRPHGPSLDALERFLAPSGPFVIIAPDGAATRRTDTTAHSTDLAPTLLALEGLAIDPRVSGRPLFEGLAIDPRMSERPPFDAGPARSPPAAPGLRARLTEGRGGRSLRTGPWLYVERDAVGAAHEARPLLFDTQSLRPRDVTNDQPEALERARDELALALSRHRSPETRQSDALAGSRFEPPPPSPRASVRLRFYGGSRRHRVVLRLEKPARGPGEVAPTLRVTPVGLDPEVLYEGPSFVDAAFFTRPDLAPGFDLELAPSTTPLRWQLSWDDHPLEGSNWFAGPYGLSLPSLSQGLLDESARRFAETFGAPVELSPEHETGVLILWNELPDPP